MPRICLLHSYDHRKHVIIKRQINTFLDKNFDICVIDHSNEPEDHLSTPYRHVPIKPLIWDFVIKNSWRLIRRIPSQKLHNLFWSRVLWFRMWSNANQMARIAAREKPDYYIGEDLQSTWAAILAARIYQNPVFYCAHELESEQGDATTFRRQLLRSLEEKLIPQVDCLITPNYSRAAVYAARYDLRAEPVVIQNCPPSSPSLKSNKLREILGLANSVHIVLYHGALIPYRSLDKLMESVTYFKPKIVLVVIGEQGSYFRDILEPIWISNRLQDRVFFLPYIAPDEISPYVASADLGIVIYENINLNNYLCAPTKLYEYMMMKVPVAACNFPELIELFKQYPVGVTFDPHDAASIAQGINSFFAKKTDELALTENALVRARQDFTWENESLKWLKILNVSV